MATVRPLWTGPPDNWFEKLMKADGKEISLEIIFMSFFCHVVECHIVRESIVIMINSYRIHIIIIMLRLEMFANHSRNIFTNVNFTNTYALTRRHVHT